MTSSCFSSFTSTLETIDSGLSTHVNTFKSLISCLYKSKQHLHSNFISGYWSQPSWKSCNLPPLYLLKVYYALLPYETQHYTHVNIYFLVNIFDIVEISIVRNQEKRTLCASSASYTFIML